MKLGYLKKEKRLLSNYGLASKEIIWISVKL